MSACGLAATTPGGATDAIAINPAPSSARRVIARYRSSKMCSGVTPCGISTTPPSGNSGKALEKSTVSVCVATEEE